MARVLLDTNVCVSALQFSRGRGITAQALERAVEHDELASCAEMERELVRILSEKFNWEPARVLGAMRRVFGRAVRVRLRHAVKVCRDPNDDMFLECAALASAELLVTGDKDLLVLGSFEGVRIITPAEYVLDRRD